MQYEELADFLQYVGKDPSRLIFEDELTGIHNRRFALGYLEHRVDWRSGEDFPLSVLSIDLDRFKEINDTHGHDAGDQLLTWVGSLLTSVAGDGGLPVRFGGDEFLLILPGAGRDMAQSVADRLLQSTTERPFRERYSGLVVPMTLSVGVAVAPDDGGTREALLQAADAALYLAKQSGRNRVNNASEVAGAQVFPGAALKRLKQRGIAGREEELRLVEEALRDVASGACRALLFQGPSGVGKTTLLEAVRRNLKTYGAFVVTKVSGDPQEAGRPYYLAARILLNLLNQQGEEGAKLVESLEPQQRTLLAHVLPGLVPGEASGKLDRSARQGIFNTFTELLQRAVDGRPAVLLVDDLEFADEATLTLLGTVAQRGALTYLLCGTAPDTLRLSGETTSSPVERFCTEAPPELAVRRVGLPSFSPSDVVEYLESVFPDVRIPEGLDADLARVTGGNPLFLSEIVRSLVDDGKVQLVGQDWEIADVDDLYLARSLEEIVTEKIAALEGRDRDILERASTLGEDVPVSMLAGSSQLDETSVQEFLDRAEDLGLVSLDFNVNDEVMHFLGKRILDISYGGIEGERRRELHEEVGRYQEQLYEQKLLPSASILAYHFRRSADQAKARRYEQVHREYADSVFEPGEVTTYASDVLDEEIEVGEPLDEDALALLPRTLRMLLSAERNIRLYPTESQAIIASLAHAKEAMDGVLAHTGRLTLTHSGGMLFANGEEVSLPEQKALLFSIVDLCQTAELSALSFTRGVPLDEIRSLLATMAQLSPGVMDRDFWARVGRDRGFTHIELRQMRYARVAGGEGTGAAVGRTGPEDEQLTDAEIQAIPGLLRDLLKAHADIRLYSMGSGRGDSALRTLLSSLQAILTKRPILVVAHVDSYLLANGTRLETSHWQSVVDGFIALLRDVGIVSITFHSSLTRHDLEVFFGRLSGSGGGADQGSWETFALDHGLSGIAFNQEAYAAGLIQAAMSGGPADPSVVAGGWTGAEAGAPGQVAGGGGAPPAEVAEADVVWEAPPAVAPDAVTLEGVRDALLQGRLDIVRTMLEALCEESDGQDGGERMERIRSCGRIFDALTMGLQRTYASIALEVLSPVLRRESDPEVLKEITAVLCGMAGPVIRFSDYRLAARVYGALESRRAQLVAEGGEGSAAESALAALPLHESIQQLLVDDLRSGRTDRQTRASLVLAHMGDAAVPMLVDVIKLERELRVRQMAAGLLVELGTPTAALSLKETLLTEVLVEHRYRILEVVDLVASDLRAELAFSLVDDNAKIRRAAFQLFERLRRDDLVDLMIPLAEGDDAGAAKGAIRSLSTLGTPRGAEAIVGILKGAKAPGLVTACCKALGSLKADIAVGTVARVLSKRRFAFTGFVWNEEARAAAALALSQIATPKALQVLSDHRDDPEARVREVARRAATMP